MAGPADWGVNSPYNWIGLNLEGAQVGWSVIGEVGSDGWNDTSLRNISFSYRFFDGTLKLSLAKPFVDHYTMHSYIEWLAYGSRLFDRENGFLVEFFPRPGLALAGGVAIPLKDDAGLYPDAVDVYRNFRFAASYTDPSLGKIIIGYINDHDPALSDLDGKELMLSVDFRNLKPLNAMIGYQGFFEGGKEHRLYGAASLPLGKLTLVADLAGKVAPDLTLDARFQTSYALEALSVGSDFWWLSAREEIGAMPFARVNLDNGYLRLGFRYGYERSGARTIWSIPLTYDLWF